MSYIDSQIREETTRLPFTPVQNNVFEQVNPTTRKLNKQTYIYTNEPMNYKQAIKGERERRKNPPGLFFFPTLRSVMTKPSYCF